MARSTKTGLSASVGIASPSRIVTHVGIGLGVRGAQLEHALVAEDDDSAPAARRSGSARMRGSSSGLMPAGSPMATAITGKGPFARLSMNFVLPAAFFSRYWLTQSPEHGKYAVCSIIPLL